MTDKVASQQEAMEMLQELRTSAAQDSAESKARVEKLEAAFSAQLDASQKAALKIAEGEKALLEMQQKHADLEKMLSRPNLGQDEKSQKKAELKAVSQFLLNGEETAEFKAFYRTDSEVDGGYLVEGEVDTAITRNLVEMSPIRSVAMVQTIRSNRLSIPREDTTVTASWVGQAEEDTAQSTTFKRDSIDLNKMQVTLQYTREMLEDSFADIEGYGAALIAEQFAKLEGTAFVGGNGVLEPEGFVDPTLCGVTNTGVADNITFDSLMDVAAELKRGYNAKFFLNRATLFNIMKMKSGTNYLWSAGNVVAGVPNSILGVQYIECPDMDDVAANAYPIAYADLARAYKIIQKNGTTIVRDVYSLKKQGKVETTFYRRVGGGIFQPEAIKLLKCSA